MARKKARGKREEGKRESEKVGETLSNHANVLECASPLALCDGIGPRSTHGESTRRVYGNSGSKRQRTAALHDTQGARDALEHYQRLSILLVRPGTSN